MEAKVPEIMADNEISIKELVSVLRQRNNDPDNHVWMYPPLNKDSYCVFGTIMTALEEEEAANTPWYIKLARFFGFCKYNSDNYSIYEDEE